MKKYKNRILTLGIIGILLIGFGIPYAAEASDVSIYLSPAQLNKNIGDTFDVSVKINPNQQKVCAVEGKLNLEKLSCQKITMGSGISPQASPSCDDLGFLLGIQKCTISEKTLFTITVKTESAGSGTINFTGVDVIGEGVPVASIPSGATYTIVSPVEPVEPPEVVVETPTLITPVTPEPIKVDETINKNSVCTCEDWNDWEGADCGAGDCLDTQLSQSRSRNCDPLDCDIIIENRCVTDDSCDSAVPVNDDSQANSNLGANLRDFVKNIPWWTLIILAFAIFIVALLIKKNKNNK